MSSIQVPLLSSMSLREHVHLFACVCLARARARVCVYVCVCACVRVLDCVFGNSEDVQTVYKVCKLMYCAVVQTCPLQSFVFILAYEVCSQVF